MSSQRGNVKKSGPPKYQNKRAFKNNLHDKTNKIKMINSLDLWGICKSCKDVIDWKIKYKKYKPLTQARTCVKCGQKTVKRAYYTVCQQCSKELKICGKCGKTKEIVENIGLTPEEEMSKQAQREQELKQLPERKRRALVRNLKAGNYDGAEENAGAVGGEDEDSELSDVGHTDTDDEEHSDNEGNQDPAEESDNTCNKDETNTESCSETNLGSTQPLKEEVSIEALSLKED